MELKEYDVIGLKNLQSQNKISNLDIFDYFLDRYERFNDAVNALYGLDEQKIRENLKKLPKESSCLIPIPTKELTEVKGEPTYYGSNAFKGNIATFTRDSLSLLFNNGFYNFGRSKACEFGIIPHTHSTLHGSTNNPWNLEKNSGGSSGGAAAAVAAGIAPIAHATDGGGSTRIPSSFCGLVGFKPSRGRLPCGPMLSYSFLSTGGVISKSVRDQKMIYDKIWTPDFFQDWNAPAKKTSYDKSKPLKIGFLIKPPFSDVDIKEANNICDQYLKKLSLNYPHTIGIEEFSFKGEDTATYLESFVLLWASLLNGLPEDKIYEDATKYLIELASNSSALDLQRAINRLSAISKHLHSQMSKYDFIISPALPNEPETNSSLLNKTLAPKDLINVGFNTTPYTPWINVLGLPAITLPVGFWDSGMPYSVQIFSPKFEDDRLLEFCSEIEKYLGYCSPNGDRTDICAVSPQF